MGVLVQREFTVAADDRGEFERQSRLGVWENMRYNGAEMIAYGTWAFGGDGDVVVTNSVYETFDHWTATRAWGASATEPARIEETRAIRAIFAGRPRLIRSSRATIVDYDDALSAPTPRWRHVGAPLLPTPRSFGRESIVEESRMTMAPASEDRFLELSRDTIWPALVERGARVLIVGRDPLAPPLTLVVMIAFRDVTAWHANAQPAGKDAIGAAVRARDALIGARSTKLLMIGTDYGAK